MITISTIEENGVPEGTLKPIAEEFYDVLNKDIVFQIAEEKPIKYFIKMFIYTLNFNCQLS